MFSQYMIMTHTLLFLQRIPVLTMTNNSHDGCWALKSHFNDTSTISYREIQLLPWQTIPKRVWRLSTTTPCMKGNNDAVFILLILPCHYILYVVLSCGYLQQHLARRVISQSWCCCFFTCDSKTHVKQVKSGAPSNTSSVSALLLWISMKASTELVDIKGSFETKLTSLWKSPVGVCSMPRLIFNLSSWSLVYNVIYFVFGLYANPFNSKTIRFFVLKTHPQEINLQTHIWALFCV